MKKLLVLILLLVGAVLIYNYTTSGEIAFLPSAPLTGEEQELQRLERKFETAAAEFDQALRSAGLAGLDTTGDADAAMREVERIEGSLDKLLRRLAGEDARRKAERLLMRLREFKRRAGA